MGFELAAEFNGVALKDAHYRIDWMNLNALNGNPSVEVQVGMYASADKANTVDDTGAKTATPQNAIERKSYVLDLAKGDVSLKAAYLELMKLEEYSKATTSD